MITLGSCLDPVSGLASLADSSVDCVITDPPYEVEAHTKGKRQGPTYDGGVRVVDAEFDFVAIDELTRSDVALHIGRIVKRWAVVFCQVEAVHAWRDALVAGGLVYRRTIPWVKPDAMPCLHGRWPGQSFEALVIAGRVGSIAPIGGKARYYQHTRETGETRSHPTAKPLSLMREIVGDFSNADELICDPFAGSGSTGVACNHLKRRFIGWEISPEYHAIAERRLRGEEAKPRHEQPSLFV